MPHLAVKQDFYIGFRILFPYFRVSRVSFYVLFSICGILRQNCFAKISQNWNVILMNAQFFENTWYFLSYFCYLCHFQTQKQIKNVCFGVKNVLFHIFRTYGIYKNGRFPILKTGIKISRINRITLVSMANYLCEPIKILALISFSIWTSS